MRSVALVVVIATGVVSIGASAARGDEPDGTKIVFASTREGRSNVYAINPDGSGLVRLSSLDEGGEYPIPSPDGSRIAFFGDRSGELFVVSADGSDQRRVGGCKYTAAWSPDGRSFVCETRGFGTRGISVVAADGSGGRILTRSGSSPRWSPDGRWIAYDDVGLVVVPTAGGEPRSLSRRSIRSVGWSPDSSKIVVVQNAPDRDHLEVAEITLAATQRVLAELGKADDVWLNDAVYSPDGLRIAYEVRSGATQTQINVMRADGNGKHRVSVSAAGESAEDPAWSPDGRSLIYARGRFRFSDYREADLEIAGVDGRARHALTRPFPAGGGNYYPAWTAGRTTGPAPTPLQTLAVRPASMIRVDADWLSADGARVAVEHGCAVSIWTPPSSRVLRRSLCNGDDDGESAEGTTLSGSRLLWIEWSCSCNLFRYQSLKLADLRRRWRPTLVGWTNISNEDASGDTLTNLSGDRGLFAFTRTTTVEDGEIGSRDAWLVNRSARDRTLGPCPKSTDSADSEVVRVSRLCRQIADDAAALAVDRGRVVLAHPSNVVSVSRATGGLVARRSVGARVDAAALDGSTLAVQSGTTLFVYDPRSARVARRVLRRSWGGAPRLIDVAGGIAVYVEGAAVHVLRLSDGRDLALTRPGLSPPVRAQLEASGLFFSYYRKHVRRPGRVEFVPMRSLRAQLARAG